MAKEKGFASRRISTELAGFEIFLLQPKTKPK
jgi:hypothetical protein